MQHSQNQRYGTNPETGQQSEETRPGSYTGTPVQSSYTGTPVQSSYTGTPAQSSYTGMPVQSTYTGAPVQSSYTGGGAGYGTTSAQAGIAGYGSVAQTAGMQQPSAANPGVSLTQAGVSNFSQQINTAYQHLQQVQRELIQTQNQIEVQAQAQIRQIRQLQQLIETAGNEVQQIESMSRMQGGANRSYPLS